MEHAAFEPPLSDQELQELGRLVVNFGFAEFLLGIHVAMLLNVPHSSRTVLVNNLSLRRKLDILENGLDEIPGKETRAYVTDACKLIGPAVPERNLLLHGIWGYDGEKPESKALVATTIKKSGVRHASDITKTTDVLAVASRKLKHALVVDSGGKIEDKPERLVLLP